MSILQLVKTDSAEDKLVGNVFSESQYGIDRISVTLREGMKLSTGSYVFLVDDDGLPIVYQVVVPYWFRPSFDFEESLITVGNASSDRRIQRYRCLCTLVGKLTKDNQVEPPRNPIRPFSDVYTCSPEMAERVIHPLSDWRVRVGLNPETGREVLIDLNALVRQGLVVTGAQGTGKTTGLLTLLVRSCQASPPLRFLMLDWTGEFQTLAKQNLSVELVNWERFASTFFSTIHQRILDSLSTHASIKGKNTREYKLLAAAINSLHQTEEFPTQKAIIDRAHHELPRLWSGSSKLKESDAKAIIENIERVVQDSDEVPTKPPPLEDTLTPEEVCAKLAGNHGVVVDFSYPELGLLPDDQDTKNEIASALAQAIWTKASNAKGFGCLVVTDEAHRLLAEGSKYDNIWRKLATEGGRNGCPLWIVARRLALVDKTITIESQQNIVSFNTEDVDRRRIQADLGEDFAGMLGSLPPGEAMVKSMGFRVPGQVVHVKFDVVAKPSSPPPAKDRFSKMTKK